MLNQKRLIRNRMWRNTALIVMVAFVLVYLFMALRFIMS